MRSEIVIRWYGTTKEKKMVCYCLFEEVCLVAFLARQMFYCICSGLQT